MPLTAFRDPATVVCSFALVLTVVWGFKSGRKDYSRLWSPGGVWRGVKFSLVKKLFSRKQGWQTKSMKLKMSSAITNTAYEQTQSSQFTVKKHQKELHSHIWIFMKRFQSRALTPYPQTCAWETQKWLSRQAVLNCQKRTDRQTIAIRTAIKTPITVTVCIPGESLEGLINHLDTGSKIGRFCKKLILVPAWVYSSRNMSESTKGRLIQL